MRHGARAFSFPARLFNLMKTADYLAGWELFSARAWGSASLFERNPSHRGDAAQGDSRRDGGDWLASSNATPSGLEVSLRSLNLPPILARGFAHRAFRLFAPARFLQGFCELQEQTEGGIYARPAKCCREIPQKHGDAVMRFHKRLGKRISRMHPTCRVLTRLVNVICQNRSLHFAS